jgi:hypothetical protein
MNSPRLRIAIIGGRHRRPDARALARAIMTGEVRG